MDVPPNFITVGFALLTTAKKVNYIHNRRNAKLEFSKQKAGSFMLPVC